MRHLISIALLLCINYVTHSQTLSDYYTNVYKAEDCIIQEKYDSALLHYQNAFKTKYLFAKDIYNNLVASLKIRQIKIADKAIVKLLSLGAKMTELSKNEIIKNYFDNCSSHKILLFETTKLSYNREYRRQLKELEYGDQKIRKEELEAYTTKKEETKKIDKENIRKLLILIDKYGFPSESKVGIDENSYQIPHLGTLMIHQANGEFQIHNFTTILETAYKQGELQNKLANQWCSFQNAQLQIYPILRYGLIKIIDTTKPARSKNIVLVDTTNWFQLEISKDEIEKVNLNRSRFLLEPYNKFVLKEVFAKDNIEFIIGEGMNVLTVFISDEKEFRKFKEKYK